ncbi:MAG: heme lyase CcmF/NrfE family subunit [Alphaproteobacteria bacterium]|jgi:cytochrome c-type biogenesis protein CcmF|nr:heme lyase CcmF/NrfE family subunit [Alphaproteobacteria bacterium]
MIAELGHYALVLALSVALVQATVPMIGAWRGIPGWIGSARPAAIVQCLLVIVAFGALTYGYVTSDFSLLNVASNSHSAKPLLYKISGVWGNHEGSLLLWLLILVLFGGAVAVFGGNLPAPFRARVLAVQAMIAVGFTSFVLFTSNPFERLLPAPMDGRGLNPLLQDPGLAFHPPFLYLGYVGFSMAFSFAVAALIEGRVDAAWARWVRPWTLAAWCFLTLGIGLGSWWAYYELGWGGWWFWDPVENASFMPWLAGTALLHSAIVVEKRDSLKNWTVLLAILTFSLSLLGTFLVRSGVLTSVHAFATDPARGVFILAFLVAVIAGSLTLYAVRAPAMKGGGLFAPVSREGGLVFNNLLLSTACATVLLGTLYPLFLDAVTGEKITVGPPYFNMTFGPLMVPVFIAMAVGPMLPWKRGDLLGALQRLKFTVLATLVAMFLTLALAFDGPWLAIPGIALGVWMIAASLEEGASRIRLFRGPIAESLRRLSRSSRSAWGTTFAHAGAGMVIIGIVASSAWQVEKLQVMRQGESQAVGAYQFRFEGAVPLDGPNYAAVRGTFHVSRDGKAVAVLQPESRRYENPPMETTEAAIRTGWGGDLYAVVGDPTGDGAWSTRFYTKPMIHWIWIGAFVMVFGGALSLTDRRFRIGAPARARNAARRAGIAVSTASK